MMDEFQRVIAGIEWHLGWWDRAGGHVDFEVWYRLAEGPKDPDPIKVSWAELDPEIQRQLRHLIQWGLDQVPDGEEYSLFGKAVRPDTALDALHFPVFGKTKGRPNVLILSTWVWHPNDKKERGPSLEWAEAELPPEIHELARSFDQTAWTLIKSRLVDDFGEDAPDVPPVCPPMAYIAYRDSNDDSKETAQRLSNFLRERGLRAFCAPFDIGWGRRLYEIMDRGMAHADAAVLCYSPDFLTGVTARKEFEFFCKRLEADRDFVAGLVLIGVDFEDAPEPFRDNLNSSLDGPEDPHFDDVAGTVYRGLLGLGQNSPDLNGNNA